MTYQVGCRGEKNFTPQNCPPEERLYERAYFLGWKHSVEMTSDFGLEQD
jgi:hypothetical protein